MAESIIWTFLQKCIGKLGFSQTWIRVIFLLMVFSWIRVLIAGSKGPFIQLSRSVRQGCPFAPFLFLFFAEALHMYLTVADAKLQRPMPTVTRGYSTRCEICRCHRILFRWQLGKLIKGRKCIRNFLSRFRCTYQLE